MPHTTIGTKHQVVIPLAVRKLIEGLSPGKRLSIHAVDAHTMMLTVPQEDQVAWHHQARGAMKAAWRQLDALAAIQQHRAEWDG